MPFNIGKMHTTIRLTVVSVFIVSTVLTALVAIGLQYRFGHSMARNAADDIYATASSAISSELHAVARVNSNVIDLLAENRDLPDPNREAAQFKIFTQVLRKNPLYYGVYLGRADGSFFEVINLDTSDYARKVLRALPTDRWLIVTLRDGPQGRERHYQYLDEKLSVRLERAEPTDFDVTRRPWFQDAISSGDVEVSRPYLFAQLGVPGRTFSKSVAGSDTVVAVDMTLDTTSEFLRDLDLAQDSDIYLYNLDGDVIASSVDYHYAQPKLPVPPFKLTEAEKQLVASMPTLKVSNEVNWPPFDYTQSGQPRGYAIDIIRMISAMTGLQVEFINGYSWQELVEQFQQGEIDLLHPVVLTDLNSSWGLAGEPIATLPYALVTRSGHAPLKDLADLSGQPVAVAQGWSIIPVLQKKFPELNLVEVANTRTALAQVLSGEVGAALDNEVITRYLARHYFLTGLQYHSNIGMGDLKVPDKLHIMVAQENTALRELIDRAISAIGERQRSYLEKTWLEFDTELSAAASKTVPSQRLIEIARNPELQGKLQEADIAGKEYLVFGSPAGSQNQSGLHMGILAPMELVVAPFLEKVTLSILITSGFLLMILPLSWFFADPIVRPVKQLALENDKVRLRDYDGVKRVASHVKELDELSESMVAMVKSIQAYELAQQELMDAFIQLIAEAIDHKSPYTGGHCERVPELALMLAKQASEDDSAAFQSFKLEGEEQWREYRIAAWLHDCGKITTPEHIVDKGSKLETIYNRIHEVRTRFEVLWRDVEIEFWEQLEENPERRVELQKELSEKQAQLQDDYGFVAECNVGGEFLDDEKQERLRQIGLQSWIRQFDDRIGLSPLEELRFPDEPSNLPSLEPLLSDKPEHIIERTRSTAYDPALGINMDVPEHLYNQGEIYNLSISRGTLTAEDRFKINEHMISTIKMLESLPFPEELKNVPRYASTHHETMKGSGYPRKLPGDQLSIPERILAVADVFEALTASDRPYKKAKPVSVAVDILHKMVLDNHIDRDCFELFLRTGIYQEYAQQYLDPSQLDEVNVAQYLSQSA